MKKHEMHMRKAKEAMAKMEHHHKMAHESMKMEGKEDIKKGKKESEKTYKMKKDCKM